jgi:two-component system sensor histidine kinase CpxA
MPPHHRYQFSLGLLIIGIVVALLIIPVSKFITDRVKGLKNSALRIADGELSHRVTVKARDEIGELGIAFNQMAERLERMIVGGKELTANISHELRTPLTRIRIAQEMLAERLEKGDFSRCKGRLNQIREDIEELDALIGSILELSKLDVHEMQLKHEQFCPADLLDELLEKLAPVISHKNLSVQKSLPESPEINGDRAALNMALSNILDNAAKFSPENGAIRIDMSPNGDFFNICVTNTYETLPEKDLIKIFEPFYRSKKSSATGTGLGLAIAAKIVQKHGGRIKASNARDGLEICVGLPVERRKAKRHKGTETLS